MSGSTIVQPLPQADLIKARISELATALQERLPNYESLLHTIHHNLAVDPDTVHFLTDEEIGVICAGLQKKAGIEIAKAEVAKASKGRRGKIDLAEL